MTCLKSVKECSCLDRIKNNDTIREELNIFVIWDKLNFYRQKCTEHVNRMPEWLSKSILNYHSQGRRYIFITCKQWTETGGL